MAVASPCTQVCSIDPLTGYCTGCLRTIDEIVAWGASDDGWKGAVIERLKRRSIRKG